MWWSRFKCKKVCTPLVCHNIHKNCHSYWMPCNVVATPDGAVRKSCPTSGTESNFMPCRPARKLCENFIYFTKMMQKYLKKYNKRPFILIFLKSMCFFASNVSFRANKISNHQMKTSYDRIYIIIIYSWRMGNAQGIPIPIGQLGVTDSL